MPELPEVEFAARSLRRWASGRRIDGVSVEARAARLFRPATPRTFARRIAGARVGEVRRIGKHLLVSLETPRGALGLLAHLGMTGKWVRDDGGPAPRFSRAAFRLDDGTTLHFSDLRLFGRLRLVPGARFEDVPEVAALGPDPIADGVDVARLAALLARSRLPVKARIMDQAVLAGVGNIYASEALFRARLDPRRPSKDLSRAEAARVAAAILAVLEESLARDAHADGIEYVEEPGAENPFLVYDREGARCPRCGKADLARIVQAQRSTFFCPRCQR